MSSIRNNAPRAAALNSGVLDSLLGYRLRRAQVYTFQNFAAVVGELRLTPGQVGALELIRANRGLSQSELAAALGIDRSTLVAVIDGLEKRTLVKRHPSPTDRRSYALALTDAGAHLLRQALRRIRLHEREIARNLNATERIELLRLLAKIA